MEFIFECSNRYRTSERSERVRLIECEHEKINSISPSAHVLFCLLYKQESAIPLTKTMPYSREPDKCISVKTRSSTKYSKKINTNIKNVRYLVQNIKDKING